MEAASKALATEVAVEEIAAEEEVSAVAVKIEEESVIFSVVIFKDISLLKEITAVDEPSAKYYQLSHLHGRWWRKRRKIGIWVEDHQILQVMKVWRR